MFIRQYQKIKNIFSRSLFVLFEKLVPKNEKNLVTEIFQNNSVSGKESMMKLKIYLVLKALIKRKRSDFGMLVVYNWKREWLKNFASFPDVDQDLFKDKRFDFFGKPFDKCLELFSGMVNFDGAIIINNSGLVVASGVYLENMDPKSVAARISGRNFVDLSSAFGFRKKVHARHLSGIACSFKLHGTTVFTISEEDGSLRVLEKGKIVFSSIKKEIVSTLS